MPTKEQLHLNFLHIIILVLAIAVATNSGINLETGTHQNTNTPTATYNDTYGYFTELSFTMVRGEYLIVLHDNRRSVTLYMTPNGIEAIPDWELYRWYDYGYTDSTNSNTASNSGVKLKQDQN